jgi:membrane associated rhomboid family serine protease
MASRFNNFIKRFFVPRRDYVVTPVIFFINLVLFIVVSIYDGNIWFPSGETVLKFGADAPFLTLDGQWWRLFTACFLHFGIIHFAANMFALIQLGLILEQFVGSLRLAFAYVFCGIAGNVVSNWWYSDTASGVSAGASGAIFGLLGFFLALVTTEFVRKETRGPLLKSIGITLLINVIISLEAHINSAAHFGGMGAGIIAGYLIWVLYKLNLPKRELIFSGLVFVFTLASIFLILPFIPKDTIRIHQFNEKIAVQEAILDSAVGAAIQQQAVSQIREKEFVAQWNDLIKRTDSLRFVTDSKNIDEAIAEQKTYLAQKRDLTQMKLRVARGDSSYIPAIARLEEELKQYGQ